MKFIFQTSTVSLRDCLTKFSTDTNRVRLGRYRHIPKYFRFDFFRKQFLLTFLMKLYLKRLFWGFTSILIVIFDMVTEVRR